MGYNSLSVIMFNYNHAKLIGEALEAIFSQSYRPVEVIVTDDASTDNSLRIIEYFVRQNPVVRLIKREKNMGAAYNIKTFHELPMGDYVYSAAADDRILLNFFEKSMTLLSRYPQAGLCCSDPIFFDDKTGVLSENRFGVTDKPCYFPPDIVAELIKKTPFWIAGHTSIIKRAALFEAGGYIPELKWHCDWFAHLVISFRYGVCYIPEPLAAMRVSNNSYSASGRRDWSTQRGVLNHMLHLLTSTVYSDVLPLFQRSGVLACFGINMLQLLLANPEYWDCLSPLLIKRILWHGMRDGAYRFAPSLLKRLYRYIRQKNGKYAMRSIT